MMRRLLRAELLKLRRNKGIIGLTIMVVSLVTLLFLWNAFWANDDIRQPCLKNVANAGAYGLLIFVTIFRKIWSILFGFLLVSVENKDHASDFFIQNTSRRKMWTAKLLLSGLITLAITILVYMIPASLSFIACKQFEYVSPLLVLEELLAVWLMTLGGIILGMIVGLYVNDIIFVGVVLGLLEFFSNFCDCYWNTCLYYNGGFETF